MTVKSSISLTDQQDGFVRHLVAEGRYASASAVIQKGLDLLQQQTEAETADTAALKAILAERATGEFLDADAIRQQLDVMIAERQSARVAD
ncbi:type II toxin-antitoxin system ParD family antitoxin [Cognatiyoonia sp. IB215182]|uniref:type II toxin-antitoxin system ParD family antitoxin n=1 Tax=Cognatiyoonia sp. IB215182 TaxID=3097353 RepID=UPI002A12EFE7|nr:type II toxin-antitoxin system ParD family antitoxin [Cognatiyoonia sp. IB215182]MDX8354802.1 type II toxin-antitoxin system ParD family antitoxin [Cognatiyoonia sp. IB215182]